METPTSIPVTLVSTERPKRSPTLTKLFTAMAKAAGQMENADKDGKGTYGKYATLAATWDVIRKPLADNELGIYQRIISVDGKPTMCTMIFHSSGEFIDDCELELKFENNNRMNAMQAMGSAVTYARRYSLQSVTGVAPADDDDAAGSGDPKGKGDKEPPTGKDAPPKKPVGGALKNHADDLQKKKDPHPPVENQDDKRAEALAYLINLDKKKKLGAEYVKAAIKRVVGTVKRADTLTEAELVSVIDWIESNNP